MSSTEIILTGMVLLAALACLPALYWSTLRIERLRVQHQELASGLAAALRELELLAAMVFILIFIFKDVRGERY